ncbi:MAG: hypothetical protein ACK5XN_33590, partial [Bacteroidota bacterium]
MRSLNRFLLKCVAAQSPEDYVKSIGKEKYVEERLKNFCIIPIELLEEVLPDLKQNETHRLSNILANQKCGNFYNLRIREDCLVKNPVLTIQPEKLTTIIDYDEENQVYFESSKGCGYLSNGEFYFGINNFHGEQSVVGFFLIFFRLFIIYSALVFSFTPKRNFLIISFVLFFAFCFFVTQNNHGISSNENNIIYFVSVVLLVFFFIFKENENTSSSLFLYYTINLILLLTINFKTSVYGNKSTQKKNPAFHKLYPGRRLIYKLLVITELLIIFVTYMPYLFVSYIQIGNLLINAICLILLLWRFIDLLSFITENSFIEKFNFLPELKNKFSNIIDKKIQNKDKEKTNKENEKEENKKNNSSIFSTKNVVIIS